MTTTIETLIPDIEKLLVSGTKEVTQEVADKFGKAISDLVVSRLTAEKKKPTLRMSNIGQPCERKLWYEINRSEEVEPFDGPTILKFLFGDLTEELVLFLAELAGHKVEGRQDVQEISGILGHRDAVIDGTLVDVKSASTYSFNKFKSGGLKDSDPFGYITQLQSYLHAGQRDDTVRDKSRAAFFVVDKTLGNMCLDFHEYQKLPLEEIYEGKKNAVSLQQTLPDRAFQPEPEGKSGNMALPLNCSYCNVKHSCHPNLRTFISSRGPVYYSKIVREPKMLEVTQWGSKNNKEENIVLAE